MQSSATGAADREGPGTQPKPQSRRRLRDLLTEDPALALLVFIVVALPFELTKQLFPYQWIEVSRMGMAVGVAYLVVRAARRQLRPVPRLLAASVLLVAVSSGLSALATRWPEGVSIEIPLLAYAAFALFVTQAVRSPEAIRVVFIALAASGVVVAFLLIAETLGGFYLWYEHSQQVLGRVNGPFADPNVTSRFLAIAVITLLALVAMTRSGSWRALRWPLLALFVIAVGDAMTQSRAGWLVAAVAITGWVIVTENRRRALAAVAALVIGFIGTLYVNPQALGRAQGVAFDAGQVIGALTGGSSQGANGGSSGDVGPALAIDPLLNHLPLDSVRRYLARAGVAMFTDHPLTGVGLGGFQPEILGPYRKFVPSDREPTPVSLPHTEIVRIAAETGIVGLGVAALLVVVLLLTIVRAARASPELRTMALAIGLGMLIIGIASQFEGRLYDEPYLWLLVGLAGAAATFPRAQPPEAAHGG